MTHQVSDGEYNAVRDAARAFLATRPDLTCSDLAQFSITDDGPGFTPQERNHLFDPFFSGRQAGRGDRKSVV